MVKKSVNLLPAFFRTDKNSKFLSSTLDQFIKDPQLDRLDGFVGSKLSKNYNPNSDQYITYSQSSRNKYQLEPGLIIKTLDGAISKAYGYDDLINQISYHSGHTGNLNRLFKPDFYSYDPHVNWDKLINYREYYWLPTGPSSIKITGTQRELISTFSVTKDPTGNFFVFTPDGLTPDPLITLYRGVTYVFNVTDNSSFYIRKDAGYGTQDLYDTEVIGNGAAAGQVIFTVGYTTPNVLYYASESDQIMGGQFIIKTIDENSTINVDDEIVGKRQYKSGNGVEFINGLKVNFGGDVTPSTYRNKDFIVEGVGDKISLVEYSLLETPEYVGEQFDPDFDVENFDDFPFDDFLNVPLEPSYITINRASKDLNSWTRYNRWFHADVIRATDPNATLPVDNRAQRPIIEFAPDLQLFNFGKVAIRNVDLIDNLTKDAFSVVEGSDGYWVDNILLEEGFRVIFNADTDPLVAGRIYEVRFDSIEGVKKVNLVEAEDGIPISGACVTVTRGKLAQGKVWWFNSSTWIQGQQRTEKNQAPLFDIFDEAGNSYGSAPYTSNFTGTKLFGYAVGSGVNDPVLGFPLKYKSSGTESSYIFNNYFTTDEIIRAFPDISITSPVSAGYLKSNRDSTTPAYVNVWTDAVDYQMPVIQFQDTVDAVNSIEVTTFDNPGLITDIVVHAYVNDVKTATTLTVDTNKLFVNFSTPIPASANSNRILLEIYTSAEPNDTGVYETPINLTNNPLNGPIGELILSELYDHVQTMVDRDPEFTGIFPGYSNLGNLPFISKYGSRIVSNKNPIAFAHYFISNKSHNVVEAIAKANDDYNQFKLNLIKTIGEMSAEELPQVTLDNALAKLNENKNVTFPYFISDMVPSGTNKRTRSYTVTDRRNTGYSITSIFDKTSVSNTAVLVYLNDTQLILGRDYDFELYDPTVTFIVPLAKGDKIVIEEYLNTDGSFVTPTPTKLGLYPKFEPKIYSDTSYSYDPVNVIQGHDGSLLVAFNDYRDAVLLEYEKRVYNNIKTEYNSEVFDINSVLPGVFRPEEYSYSEIYELVKTTFLKWTGFYGINYEPNTTYDIDNHKTYNYKSATDYIFGKTLPGSWRAIYKYYFDTDRPDTHPWEMLGITVKPDWWDSYYGPFPYTAGNELLWKDLEDGRIAQGSNAGVNPLYARPGLSQVIPVDDNGKIIDLRNWASIGQNDSISGTGQDWAFGDCGPAENAWRRSSHWPFALQVILALAKPADYTAKLFDTSRIAKNKAGQFTYETNNDFLSPDIVALHTDIVDGVTIRSAGYSVYVIEIGKKRNSNYVSQLKEEMRNGNMNLLAKLGGFVSKDKLSVVIDAVQLGTQNPTPYLPNEDYSVHFNVSNPIKTVAISGIIVIKTATAFVIRGYDKTELFFKIFNPIHQYSDTAISVGSRSEEFVTWTANQFYIAGQVVYNSNIYYRVISDHKAGTTFELKYYKALAGIPTVGGTRVAKTSKFETTETLIPYGTEMTSIQEVYDFLAGYGKWLEAQGFAFDDYSEEFQQTTDWDFTAKEFIYWTNQNWAVNSVITLSPFANSLKFRFQEGVVDNVFDSFYEYNLLRADGLSFPSNNFSLIRDGNEFTIKTKNTPEGLFYAKLNLVQKEHALVFNNTTIFGDTLYAIDTGYRQLRVKLKGFKTAEWNGDFFSPGFVYDNASIESWSPYKDYLPGDLVEYVGKYYSAKNKIVGTETFNFALWISLTEKPVASLLPNFEYKINQFEDFYSLDIDNFDLAQQKMAQHLIGYSPRTYLENIFDNPISQYKFYQGFIKEKGTRNALTKLEKASVANLQGRLEFNEEWAFRLGHFGAYSNYNEIELPLREQDFVENTQEILFVDALPASQNNLTSYITPSDLTIKPDQYVSSQTFNTTTGTYKYNSLILPHAGYVRTDDVNYTALNVDSMLTSNDVRSLEDGATFWVGFEPAGEWNVYRYTRYPRTIINATPGTNKTITLTTNRPHGLSAGEIISVTRFDAAIDGIYRIKETPTLDTFTISSDVTFYDDNGVTGTLFKFNKVRFSDIDGVADLKYIADVKEGELFWVDDNGTGKWTVYRKTDNYDRTEFTAPRNKPGQQFGHRITKQETSSTVIVSAAQLYDTGGGYGRIYVYTALGDSLIPVTNYSLNSTSGEYRPTNDQAVFGDNLFYDETDDLIFASASNASYIQSSTKIKKGLVKISGVYRVGYPTEIPYAVITSPIDADETRFGSGLVVGRTETDKKVLIGAPGYNAGTGTVYVYDLNITDNVRTFSNITGTCTSGFGASFDIQITNRDYSVSVANSGTGYTTSSYASSRIIIPGTSLGGRSPSNNLIVEISSTGTNGSVAGVASSTGTAALNSFTIVAGAQPRIDPPASSSNQQFGYKVAGTKSIDKIAVSAPNSNTCSVYIYTLDSGTYTLSQTINSSDSLFRSKLGIGNKLGEELVMSEDGNYLFIGSTYASDGRIKDGKVWIYKWNTDQFEFLQLLENPSAANDDLVFGQSISVNSNADILSITSQGANFFSDITFDNGATTFDGGSCLFGDTTRESGTAYVYNRYNTKFILAQELYDSTIDNSSYYGESVVVNNNQVYVGSPGSIVNKAANGSVYIWNEVNPDVNSWEEYRVQDNLIDTSLIKKVTTIDTLNEQVIEYLDIIDPLKGKIPGLADQEIRYKTPFDPATYSNGTSEVVVDADNFWASNQVGQLWWDLSTVKYVWYEQGDRAFRKNSWGQLFPGASIDIYEWVETDKLPSTWASQADTNEGIADGISGQPKFADDSVYTSVQKFDRNTNQFTTLYYYWVKSKTLLPNAENRRMVASEVASLLENPKGYGLQYVSVVDADAISVVNFKSNLISDRIYLNIAYSNVDSDINNHTEWVLVQEGAEHSQPPVAIEQKMIDSLLGKDRYGNLVPNPALPSRIRYGIEIRPKQSMFVDKIAALRNVMDYTNGVLATTLTRGLIDFTNLNSKEEVPDIKIGSYDIVFENVEGRNTLITKNLIRAELSCIVVNGRITEVIIDNPGSGYLIAPTVTILNTDSDAKIKTTINEAGEVVSATVEIPGSKFVTAPTLVVRNYTVIVLSDPEFPAKWSSYEWLDSQWVRTHTQSYDTTRYWKYIDWVDGSYNVFKPLSYTVEELYELATLELSAGDYVKIKNPGDNKFIILRKTDTGVIGNFNVNFDIIYSESGTIQILDSVWNTSAAQLGFDEESTFDQFTYDETAEIELQKILAAIKEDIFVGSMQVYWNKLFFKCVKYALTEQRFLDWAFKTSFINVRNIAGVLDQRTTYRFQDQEWYETYLKEIKPYHTQIRNYQVNYQIGDSQDTPWESSYTYNTDFDLPATYDRGTTSFITVDSNNDLINEYPYKGWADNFAHHVENITLVDGGKGYRTVPRIDIIAAPGDTGAGATAKAYIAFGKITEIELLTSGDGYTKTPTVLVVGGGDTELTVATAYANLSNKKVRSNTIGIKFDRVSSVREIEESTFIDTFTTNGTTYQYGLTWYASTDKNNIEVILDGILVPETDYDIVNYTAMYNGYHKKYSKLVMVDVPDQLKTLTIHYTKNIEIYSAADRVLEYYAPADGMPGKQLEQVMEGVAYPGVSVRGLPFSYSAFWDTTGFGESSWDDNTGGEVDLDTIISGGAFTTGTTGLFDTARGLATSDIILDGDGFVTPNTSHAPEEVVPGQVLESVSISVFTRQEQGAPLIVAQSSMIESTTTNTLVDLRLQPVNTSSVMVSFNNKALVYGKDYFVNFANKLVTITTQTTTGPVGITTIGVGGAELVAARTVTTSASSVTIKNLGLYSDIGSVYVTANGETLSSTSTGVGYTFSTVSSKDLSGKLVVHDLPAGTNIVQAWFFRPTYKAYSEVKEQIITVNSTEDTFDLIQMPGTLGPFHAQAVVELDGLRLTPPDTTYYSVETGQTTFDIRPDEVSAPGIFNLSQLEVHVNGVRKQNGIDFVLDQPNNQIEFNPGYLTDGDVLAITILLGADYTIANGQLVLTTSATAGQLLKIITYTNHDASNIRTEVFTANASRLYRMNRSILDDNYVWVSIDGQPLIDRIDYTILSDRKTVEISSEYLYDLGSKVVVTSFSDAAVSKSVGYRIFKDMLGRTHYKRYSEQNTTYLSQDLSTTDSFIYVDNADVLSTPIVAQNIPGVVFIAGERIEYFTKNGNILGQLRRTTLGTAASSELSYPAGTAVVDQSSEQSIPNEDTVVHLYNAITTSTTSTYSLSEVVSNSHEIEVIYQGRVLRKPLFQPADGTVVTQFKHVSTASYDSGENSMSDVELLPEFSVSGSSLTLEFEPAVGSSLRVLQHIDRTWYSSGVGAATDGTSLLTGNTAQAQFLLERQSGLPDKYQYGQN